VQDVNLRVFRGEFVRDFPRAVGRIAVHHQHVHADRQRQKFLRHAREIFPFIEVGTMMSVWFMRRRRKN
jgi:hypothetical protein